MRTVTVYQFFTFNPYLGEEQVRAFARGKQEWTALDVLRLEDVSAEDKLRAVLREEFIDTPVLHEFACRCAENALKMADNPDPRSVEAVTVKRRWLRGEATDEELAAAGAAAWNTAAAMAADAARDATWDATWAAAMVAAWDAARAAIWAATWTRDADAQVRMLIEMLEAEGNE